MRLWLVLTCFLAFTGYLQTYAQAIFTESSQRVSVGNSLELYTGDSTVSFSEIAKSTAFRPVGSDVPNLGTSNSDKWFRLPITNCAADEHLLLEIAYPLLDEVELFYHSKNGEYLSVQLGEHEIFSRRKYKIPNYVFDIHLPSQTTQIFFLRIRSTEQIILPVFVSNKLSMMSHGNRDVLINGMYMGIVLIMAIYNLFLFFSVRDKGYLYYVLYVLCTGITQMGIKGYTFQYLWPYWPEFATIGVIIFAGLSGISALLFADTFLQLKKNANYSRRVFVVFIIFFIVSSIMAIVGWKQVAFLCMQFTTGVASLFVLYVSYRIMISGYRPARYFVFGWTILLLGSLVFLLKDYGILAYNEFTSNVVQITSVIEMALLSFGLAYSINILKQEKEIFQSRELTVLMENERLIREQNTLLEQKVDERTFELQQSNDSLTKTLDDLKEAQSQLVEAEKMASLGQLTAGVAHEINNPINFVTSNVGPLKRDFNMLLETLKEVERIAFLEKISLGDKKEMIETYKEEIDLDYLKTEIEFLLKGMHDGASRTAEIVKSLRIFSRVDEDTLKFTDLNQGMESTLVILSSVIKGSNIEVNRNYGDLPKVECYAGKLNQVFLNILTNAIYAIDKKFKGSAGGKLSIETGMHEEDSVVYIKMTDNGVGIPEDIREKIFEPFFTTKEVGEGTGLGMSIAYTTIAKHKGMITVESEESKGTAFILTIPVTQNRP